MKEGNLIDNHKVKRNIRLGETRANGKLNQFYQLHMIQRIYHNNLMGKRWKTYSLTS